MDSKIGRYGPSYFRGILRIPSKIVSKRFYSLLYRLSRVLKKNPLRIDFYACFLIGVFLKSPVKKELLSLYSHTKGNEAQWLIHLASFPDKKRAASASPLKIQLVGLCGFEP